MFSPVLLLDIFKLRVSEICSIHRYKHNRAATDLHRQCGLLLSKHGQVCFKHLGKVSTTAVCHNLQIKMYRNLIRLT